MVEGSPCEAKKGSYLLEAPLYIWRCVMKHIKWWMVFGAGFVASFVSPDIGGTLGAVGIIWGVVELIRWIAKRPRKPKPEKKQKRKPEVRLPDWSVWDDSIHMADGQSDRVQRALVQSFPVIRVKKGGVSVVRGSKGDLYNVSFEGCSCEDFKRRHLPCKHMYSLAIAAGCFDPASFGGAE